MKFDVTSILTFFNGFNIFDNTILENNIKETFENLSSRKLAFDWIHTGKLNITVGNVTEYIKNNSFILPPRSGHLGNWQEIFNGRSGALDHNNIVCTERNIGYPFIIDFNQTENDSMNSGDTVYLPGSIIKNKVRHKLSLFTWNGVCFKSSSREFSYFTPFVLADLDSQLVSLTDIHKNNIIQFNNAKMNSTLMLENKGQIFNLLRGLFEYIINTNNCDIKLDDIVDKSVSLNGVVTRNGLVYVNGKYYLNNICYSDINSVLHAIFLVFESANNPYFFISNVESFPRILPLLSLPFQYLLWCILNTHYSTTLNDQQNKNITNLPFNPHFHWGAYDSAGYPPISKGYFRKKVGIIRKINKLLINLFPEIKPIFFILLPSAVFNLLPTTAYKNDYELVNQLFLSILKNTSIIPFDNSRILMNSIKKIVSDWLNKHEYDISSYYLNRFQKNRCVLSGASFDKGFSLDLPNFEKLSIQQACMILGSIHEIIKEIR